MSIKKTNIGSVTQTVEGEVDHELFLGEHLLIGGFRPLLYKILGTSEIGYGLLGVRHSILRKILNAI